MKNNIKKAPVKFREDGLYFQHFMLFLSLSQISDYHHLKGISLIMKHRDTNHFATVLSNSKLSFLILSCSNSSATLNVQVIFIRYSVQSMKSGITLALQY